MATSTSVRWRVVLSVESASLGDRGSGNSPISCLLSNPYLFIDFPQNGRLARSKYMEVAVVKEIELLVHKNKN